MEASEDVRAATPSGAPAAAGAGPDIPDPRPPQRLPADEAHEEVRLSRDLGLLDATMLGVGALMGGGVFVLLGIGAGVAGPALLLSFFLNGLITIPTLMVYAELGSAYSDTGGGYLWIKQAMKQPWGFLGGWMSWFSHAIACAVYALASGFFFTWILRYVGRYPEGWLTAHGLGEHDVIVAAALTFGMLFVLLNYIGVKVSVRAENSITWIVLGVVTVFLAYGLWGLHNSAGLARHNFADFMPNGAEGMFLAMGITFIAFEGYEIISQAGEEVRDPSRTVPRAIMLSLAIVWPIILLTSFVSLGLFPGGWEALGALGPLALVEVARHVMPFGSVLIVSCAMLLQLVALNATIYSSSRVSFAMGRDRNLPAFFGHIHAKRRTPHLSVLFSGGIVLLMAATLPIEAVAVAADIQFLLLFIMVNMAYLKLHRLLPAERFGFRAPLFPFLPFVGMAGKAFLAVYLYRYSPTAWMVALLVVFGGLGLYYLYVRPREEKAMAESVAAPYVLPSDRPHRRAFRILVPVNDAQTVRGLVLAAQDIAEGADGEIILAYTVTLPPASPLEAGTQFVDAGRQVLREARGHVTASCPVSTMVRIGHDPSLTLRSTAQEEQASLILLAWHGRQALARAAERSRFDALVDNPPCDLALVKVVGSPAPTRILETTRGGSATPVALRLAGAIAKARRASLDVLQVLTPQEAQRGGPTAAQLESMVAENVPSGVVPTVRVEQSDRVVGAILRSARDHDLVVMGDSDVPVWRGYLFGNRPEHVAALFPGSVLLVKAYRGPRHERKRRAFQLVRRIGRMLEPDRSGEASKA